MSEDRLNDVEETVILTEETEDGEKRTQKKSVNRKDYSEVLEMLKNTLIIFLITIVAGGILGVVYEMTKEPIEIMQQKAEDSANLKAFSDAASFEDSGHSYYDKYAIDGVKITSVLNARDENGELLGYVFKVTTNKGFGGDISFSMGVRLDGTICAISITSISETAGLGMNAEKVLVPQFSGRRAENFEVVKSGAVVDSQIDAISSATITSKAITNAVNVTLTYFRVTLGGGAVNE